MRRGVLSCKAEDCIIGLQCSILPEIGCYLSLSRLGKTYQTTVGQNLHPFGEDKLLLYPGALTMCTLLPQSLQSDCPDFSIGYVRFSVKAKERPLWLTC
jgi:hypothetical protein